MPKPSKKPSWRTVMRRAEKAGSSHEREMLKAEALVLRRKERKAVVPERRKSPRKKTNIKATITAKTDGVWAVGTEGGQRYSDMPIPDTCTAEDLGLNRLRATDVYPAAIPTEKGWDEFRDALIAARHAPPELGPIEIARDAIYEAIKSDVSPDEKLAEIVQTLGDLAAMVRSKAEADHVATLKKVNEAAAANVVRSYMALIDGLGHANDGPLPPAIVIPGLMAVRVYDALQKAGYSST